MNSSAIDIIYRCITANKTYEECLEILDKSKIEKCINKDDYVNLHQRFTEMIGLSTIYKYLKQK